MISPGGPRIAFAVPMYWVLDVTINILQTPFRALVSDLATQEQQVPMQARHRERMSICAAARSNGPSCLQVNDNNLLWEHLERVQYHGCKM